MVRNERKSEKNLDTVVFPERQISKITLLCDATNIFTIEKRIPKYLPEGNETQICSSWRTYDLILKVIVMCTHFAWMLQDSIQWHHNYPRQHFLLCDVYKSKHELITTAGIIKAKSSHCWKFVLVFTSNYNFFFLIIEALSCVPSRIKILLKL